MSQTLISLMANARQTVLGVVTARIGDDIPGASMLINCYIREAKKDGFDTAQAWAQLFAAAVLLVIPLLECRSVHHGEEMEETLQNLGVILAEFRQTYG